MIKKKREDTNYQHHESKRRLTTDPTDIKSIIREHYEQLYAVNSTASMKWTKIERHRLPKLTKVCLLELNSWWVVAARFLSVRKVRDKQEKEARMSHVITD